MFCVVLRETCFSPSLKKNTRTHTKNQQIVRNYLDNLLYHHEALPVAELGGVADLEGSHGSQEESGGRVRF